MPPSCTTNWPLSNKSLKKYDVAEGYYELALAIRADMDLHITASNLTKLLYISLRGCAPWTHVITLNT